MTKLTKTLLIIGLGGIVFGTLISANLVRVESAAWFVCLPAGAIFFGLFMIARTLEGVSAEYDLEQKEIITALSSKPVAQPAARGEIVPVARPAVAGAH